MLWQRLVRFVQSFGPQASKELIQNLVSHLEADADAVMLVIRMLRGAVDYPTSLIEMSEIEHRGDLLRSSLVAELARTLVTPLDREDIYRFSRSIDDLLDELRDFVREWNLLQEADPQPLLHVLTELNAAIASTALVVRSLQGPKNLESGSAQLLEALRSANRVRTVHEDEITTLFTGRVTMKLLRERELLHRLDTIGMHLVQGLNTIADSFVKRGE